MAIIATILITVFGGWFCYWMICEGDNVKKDYEQNNNTGTTAVRRSLFPSKTKIL